MIVNAITKDTKPVEAITMLIATVKVISVDVMLLALWLVREYLNDKKRIYSQYL